MYIYIYDYLPRLHLARHQQSHGDPDDSGERVGWSWWSLQNWMSRLETSRLLAWPSKYIRGTPLVCDQQSWYDLFTSSTAQGGGGSFNDRSTIGKVELLERRWRSDRWLECRWFTAAFFWSSCEFTYSSIFLFVDLFVYPTASLPVHPLCLSTYLSIFNYVHLSVLNI